MVKDNKIGAVILAGGQSKRMGRQDKGLMLFNYHPLVSYSIRALLPVTEQIVISANRHLEAYQQFNLPVKTDSLIGFNGPLAGILTALDFLETEILLVVPCDSPLLTAKHLQKLLETRKRHEADIAVVFDGLRIHPVFLALKTNLRNSLEEYLLSGNRKVASWLEQHYTVTADFSDNPELFINVNTLDDFARLRQQYS